MQFRTSILRKLGVLLSIILLLVASFPLLASPAAAETYTVKMGSDNGRLKFVPSTLTVKPGDTIEWVMNKLGPHNVVFDHTPGEDADLAKSLSKEKLLFTSGELVETTFPVDAPSGNYSFYCQPHQGVLMVGKITVE
ncbi:MAG: plastocyanin [Symploca sp. SIO1A3]|nr:plastocyanin [Symploca sp. SIO2C1]NER50748.1 plastocyanin [Symploca sp. SIO1A3]